MPAFFDLLREEPDAGVRAVLGHFVFVYIHPYIDGNGRMGRFLMNAMMASGGYPWTVIPVGERTAYMHALEKASVGEDIGPFADFLARSSGRDWPADRCPRFRRVDRYGREHIESFLLGLVSKSFPRDLIRETSVFRLTKNLAVCYSHSPCPRSLPSRGHGRRTLWPVSGNQPDPPLSEVESAKETALRSADHPLANRIFHANADRRRRKTFLGDGHFCLMPSTLPFTKVLCLVLPNFRNTHSVQRQCLPPFIPICSEGRTFPATIHLCNVIQ